MNQFCRLCLRAHTMKLIVCASLICDLLLSTMQLWTVCHGGGNTEMTVICLTRSLLLWIIAGAGITTLNRIIHCNVEGGHNGHTT